jgi:16S rRNA U516 pseudouridylate synthase RsuA-like enzyme
MFLSLGKPVLYLQRISFGGLTLPPDLAMGSARSLTSQELELLRRAK